MSNTKKENKYKKCICFHENNCGAFKRWNRDGLFEVKNLSADISAHLIGLKVGFHLVYFSTW